MNEGMRSNTERNRLMDIIKCIAAFGVVLVHFQFPGVIGRILCSVGVCGVVFFFLVSGYYAYDPDDGRACRNLLKRFRRNLIITLIAVAAYILFTVIEQLALGTFSEWAENFKNPWLIPRMIFMGDFEFIHGDPLWFMPALLYSYLILWFLHKLKITKYAYIALPLLLLLRIGTETYTNSYGADWHLSGNFLVGGLPVMLLGHYIASKKERFREIPLYLTVPFTVFSALLMFLTVNIKVMGLDVSQIFKIWCGAELLILAISFRGKTKAPLPERIGADLSLYIYLIHYAVGILIKDLLLAAGAPEWVHSYLLPPVVIVSATLLAYAIYAVKKKRKV